MKRKVAVVLLNLGSPSTSEDIEPFLFSLFSDRYVIDLPSVCRIPLAKLIAKFRSPISKKIYSHMKGESVLLNRTKAQALALESKLNKDAGDTEYKAFVCMRHSSPNAHEVVSAVHSFCPERVILLSMYPQYSLVTTQSSVEAWYRALHDLGYTFNTHIVWHYYNDSNYIAAQCDLLRQEYNKVLDTLGVPPKVLFSAHSVPLSLIKRGDLYEQHVKWNVKLILQELKIPDLNSILCYQSRITSPLNWLGPSIRDEVLNANQAGVPVLIVPLSFVAENSETVVELDISYRQLMTNDRFFRVPTLGTHPLFIECLYRLLHESNTL